MGGIEVLDGDPFEVKAEVSLHRGHELACVRAEIESFPGLGRDDELPKARISRTLLASSPTALSSKQAPFPPCSRGWEKVANHAVRTPHRPFLCDPPGTRSRRGGHPTSASRAHCRTLDDRAVSAHEAPLHHDALLRLGTTSISTPACSRGTPPELSLLSNAPRHRAREGRPRDAWTLVTDTPSI